MTPQPPQFAWPELIRTVEGHLVCGNAAQGLGTLAQDAVTLVNDLAASGSIRPAR